MEKIDIVKLYKNSKEYENKEVKVAGWVKSARGGKAFGFIDLNDGSCFKGVQIGICGIKRVLSTSFPQFVDKVMLIWIMWIAKSTDVDDLYLVFKLEKEKLYLVLWKITIFLPYFQGNYIFENWPDLLDFYFLSLYNDSDIFRYMLLFRAAAHFVLL